MKKESNPSEKRTKWFTFRVSVAEHATIMDRYKTTNNSKVSDYLRQLVFQGPVMIRYRNSSVDDFMEEVVLLRTELNAIGNNFNQVVRKLNSVKDDYRYLTWLKISEGYQRELVTMISGIQKRIDQFAEVWLR